MCEGRGPKDPLERPKRDPSGWTARRYAGPESSRILSRTFCVGRETPVRRFSQGACVGGRGWAKARGCGRVAASARVSPCLCACGCPGVRKGASVSVVLFLFLPVCLTLIGLGKT